ncbi:MAG: hypothetical protein ACYTF8_10145 [Planctomycetota bacterium]|jgi:hypothetical protein
MTTEQRLERLERENRWMQRIGAVGIAVAAVVLLVGQGRQPEGWHLVAKSVTVNDELGRPRIRLGQNGGVPQLQFLDGTGRTHITLGETPHGPLLRLRDKKTTRIVLSTDHDGSASVLLTDKAGRSRCGLGTDPDGSPSIEVWDKDGGLRAVLGESDSIDKATGKSTKKGESALTLFDAKGNLLWQAPR